MLTPHCSAASGIVVPPSIVSTTRLRKSAEYGFAIHAGLLPAGSLNHIRAAMGIPDSAFPGNALTTRVAIARFRIIRARFDKRSMQAFHKADHRSNIRNAPLPNSNIDEVCCVCLEAAASPNGELSMKTLSLWMIAAACFIAPASAAHARSAYDGSWDLAFVTEKGTCDPA